MWGVVVGDTPEWAEVEEGFRERGGDGAFFVGVFGGGEGGWGWRRRCGGKFEGGEEEEEGGCGEEEHGGGGAPESCRRGVEGEFEEERADSRWVSELKELSRMQ